MDGNSEQSAFGRRTVLTAAGGSMATALAGCLDDSVLGAEESGPESVELSASVIDLSDLETSRLDEYSHEEIEAEYSSELTLTVDDEPQPLDELDAFAVEIEAKPLVGVDADHEYLDGRLEAADDEQLRLSTARLPSFLVRDGETISVTAEVDGETVSATATVEKQLPDLDRTGYPLEGVLYRDGHQQCRTPYSDAFLFNTVGVEYEAYQDKRIQTIEEYVPESEYEEAIQNIDKQELQQKLEIENEKERKEQTIEEITQAVFDTIGRFSGDADRQAGLEEKLLRNLRQDEDQIYFVDTHTEDTEHQIFTDVYANGFDNPAELEADGNNHGSKLLYLGEDSYHVETRIPEIRHTTELKQDPPIDMVEGINHEYVSVLAQFEEGEMDELNFRTKLGSMNAMMVGQTSGHGRGFNISNLNINDSYGSKSIEMKRGNESREDIYSPLILAAEHHWETENKIIAAGTPEQPELIVTNRENIHKRVEEDPFIEEERDFQDADTIKAELLT